MANSQKKERNHVLDLMLFLFTMSVSICHLAANIWMAGGVAMEGTMPGLYNAGIEGSMFYTGHYNVFGIRGLTCIGHMTFMSGFWLVDYFKRRQRSGLIGRGRDSAIAGKYWWHNFAAYMPYCLYAIVFTIVGVFACYPSLLSTNPILTIWNTITQALPQMLGFASVDYNTRGDIMVSTLQQLAEITNGLTDGSRFAMHWHGALWYMSALICFLPLLFIVLEKCEAFAVGVLCPACYYFYHILYGTSLHTKFAVEYGLQWNFFRFLGPVALGVWGWYVVDIIKRNIPDSKASRIGVTCISLFGFIGTIMYFLTNIGGIKLCEFSTALFAIGVLSGRDYFSTMLNKILGKIPGFGAVRTISMGFYTMHIVPCFVIGYEITSGNPFWSSIPRSTAFIYGFLITLVCCIPFFFVEKYLLNRLGRWIRKTSKSEEPVVIDEPAAIRAEK